MTKNKICPVCGHEHTASLGSFCSTQCADTYLSQQMSRIESEIQQKHPTLKCPICGKEGNGEYRPFCSKRCADIDLGRWMKGNYVIHTQESPEEEELTNIK